VGSREEEEEGGNMRLKASYETTVLTQAFSSIFSFLTRGRSGVLEIASKK
jgi:hypothetical protein